MSRAEYLKSRAVGRSDELRQDDGADQAVTKLDLVDIIETEGRWGDRSTIILTADIHKARAEKERYQEYAILLRRLRDAEGKPKSTRLEIRSPIIRTGIQEVLGYYSTINMESNPIMTDKPFAPLFHYRKELRDYAVHQDRTEEESSHMKVLINFMKRYLRDVERIYDRLLPSELITQNLLWTLFRPEDVVIARRDHFTEAFVVDTCSVIDIGEDGEVIMILSLVGRSWDYNGTRFGPVTQDLHIKEFPGNKKIRDLDVYPIAYHIEPDGEDLRQKLIRRGMKWRHILDVTHREYSALAWTDPLTLVAQSFDELVPLYTSGRILLDYVTHQQARPHLATILSRASATNETSKQQADGLSVIDEGEEVEDARMGNANLDLGGPKQPRDVKLQNTRLEDRYTSHLNDSTYVMTEAQALVSPARVRGFSLTDKIWAFFLVDAVKDIKWAGDSFTTLELDANVKRAIKALIQIHGDPRRAYEKFDVIAGKGKGLIFLLTGPPGLGKTLTAESIAEETKRPLYAITSGELGTNIVQTDMILRQIFTRAKTWNAILLLDEADVFLARRERADLERNAFVSIFLRLIEYYQGILFLTTNRLDEFDEAFQSRIHLTVRYQPLDDDRRAVIWRNLLSRITSEGCEGETLKRLGRTYQINGREIKNLIRTSATLAEHEGVELTEEHIETVFKLNSEC